MQHSLLRPEFEDLQAVLLGTAGYHPNDLRQTACVFLPDVGVVLDAGSGFFRIHDLLDTTELDIFLSHAHLDHIVGLTYWFDVVYQRRITRATVHGKPEKLKAVQEHLLSEHLFPAELPYEYRPLTDEILLPKDGKLRHFPLEHPGGSTGYRLDFPGGHSLAYVTDTTATADAPYIKHIEGVKVLLHECNFKDEEEELAKLTGHSCTSAVARVAAQAGVEKLVLIHVNPLADQRDPVHLPTAKAIFPNTVIGRDGMVVMF